MRPCNGDIMLGRGVDIVPPPTSASFCIWGARLPLLCPHLPLSALQTLCEQLRKENEALKSKLDKGLEQRDQAAERLR